MKTKIKLGLLLLLFSCSSREVTQEDALVLLQIQDRNGISETISDESRLAHYKNTDFLLSQPYKKVLQLYRKEGKNRSIITTYHPNGALWQLLEAKEMRAYGAYREWFANGNQKIESMVIGGSPDLTSSAQETWLFDGTSFVWNEQGLLSATIPYDKGAISGTVLYYYPSGSIQKETPYIQDRIEGEMREFWENGDIRSKTEFQLGQKNGTSLGFWANGTLAWEETYEKNLLLNGTYWDLSHEMISEVKSGYGFKALFSENRLSQLQEIREGIQEGQVRIYTPSGVLQATYSVKNGKKHGEEIEYSLKPGPNGVCFPKISLYWDQDAIHGAVKTWYENGQLQSQREMRKNKRSGTACAWYRDGTLMLLEEYEDDHLQRGQYYRKNHSSPVSSVADGNGIATLYDEDGMFLNKILYSKGKPVDQK